MRMNFDIPIGFVSAAGANMDIAIIQGREKNG